MMSPYESQQPAEQQALEHSPSSMEGDAAPPSDAFEGMTLETAAVDIGAVRQEMGVESVRAEPPPEQPLESGPAMMEGGDAMPPPDAFQGMTLETSAVDMDALRQEMSAESFQAEPLPEQPLESGPAKMEGGDTMPPSDVFDNMTLDTSAIDIDAVRQETSPEPVQVDMPPDQQ